VPDLDKIDRALRPSQRANEPADAIAGIAKDPADPPGLESLPDKISYGVGHEKIRLRSGVVAGAPQT
jgi:hypothetical protein